MRCLLLYVFLLSITSAHANQGVFMVVKGDVQVISAKTKQKTKAKVGMKVEASDTVETAADSRAKIVMVDKNVLNLSPDSKVVIEKYEFNEGADNKNVTLNVIYGKLRSTVNQKYDGEKSQFNVKTPSAVAGVRGTDFLTSFNQVTNATKVVTFEGQVMAGSGFDPSGKIANAVAVNPGQFTVASQGAPPAPPAEVPKSELNAMNNSSAADGDNGRGSGERSPSGEGGGSGGDKQEGSQDGPSGAGSGSMGVDSGDMAAENGPAPVAAPEVAAFECATCGKIETNLPTQLPPELLNGGKTRLIINIR